VTTCLKRHAKCHVPDALPKMLPLAAGRCEFDIGSRDNVSLLSVGVSERPLAAMKRHLVAERCFLRQHPADRWGELSTRARRRLRNRAKSWLNTLAVDRMSVARFAERDPVGEIRGWLRIIAELAGTSS
jgi:hypothetical protein